MNNFDFNDKYNCGFSINTILFGEILKQSVLESFSRVVYNCFIEEVSNHVPSLTQLAAKFHSSKQKPSVLSSECFFHCYSNDLLRRS